MPNLDQIESHEKNPGIMFYGTIVLGTPAIKGRWTALNMEIRPNFFWITIVFVNLWRCYVLFWNAGLYVSEQHRAEVVIGIIAVLI